MVMKSAPKKVVEIFSKIVMLIMLLDILTLLFDIVTFLFVSFCLIFFFLIHQWIIGHIAPMRAAIATTKPDKLLMKSVTSLNHLDCSASSLSPAASAGDQNQPWTS